LRGKPKYDPNEPPLKDVVAIQKMLPHRFPFVLVDKVIEVSETHVVGVKNVTFNEHSIRRGIVQMQGTTYVGNKIVSEGELTAQIIRRNLND